MKEEQIVSLNNIYGSATIYNKNPLHNQFNILQFTTIK